MKFNFDFHLYIFIGKEYGSLPSTFLSSIKISKIFSGCKIVLLCYSLANIGSELPPMKFSLAQVFLNTHIFYPHIFDVLIWYFTQTQCINCIVYGIYDCTEFSIVRVSIQWERINVKIRASTTKRMWSLKAIHFIEFQESTQSHRTTAWKRVIAICFHCILIPG